MKPVLSVFRAYWLFLGSLCKNRGSGWSEVLGYPESDSTSSLGDPFSSPACCWLRTYSRCQSPVRGGFFPGRPPWLLEANHTGEHPQQEYDSMKQTVSLSVSPVID